MKITSSYAVEVKNINKLFRQTIKIYNDAISYCVEHLENDWEWLSDLGRLDRCSVSDKLIHGTSTRSAKYEDFDVKFPKMPQFFRLAVINTALGYLSSYHSTLEKWECNYDSTNRPPTMQTKLHKLPTFYKDRMYQEGGSDDSVRLKLFVNNDWNWVEVKLKHTDLQYIRNHCAGKKMSVPTLEKRNKKWFLRFAFEEEVTLNQTPIASQKILAVDMGINTDATCSVMTLDGAILGRKFINFASDKDQLYHTLNKIKKAQQKFGSHNTTKLWRYVNFHNEELSRKIAKAIVDYAVSQGVDVIVFEHLDIKGKKRGSKKQRLHLWRKNYIQQLVEHKAHTHGIRVSRVCAWNTSKLAFDGSGVVERHRDNYSICTFQNGKIYNCDLSASYNIGARYFIREAEKSIPAKVWSDIVAKVPECQKRVQCTYSTLIKLNQVA